MENRQNFDNDEIEIDLKELFFEFLENWQAIVISTVLAAVIAFGLSRFILTPQYESTSKLYVLTKSTSLTSLADLQMGASLTNDYVVVVAGRPVLEQVIENLGLVENYEELGEKIEVNVPSNSRIIEITVTDPDPNRAKAIADNMASVSADFISAKMDQDPPTTIQKGYSDGEPVSPSVPKYTLIGALLGMILAMGIVAVSYILNDTIMTSEDLERKIGINVLGVLPLEESEYDGEKKKRFGFKKRK